MCSEWFRTVVSISGSLQSDFVDFCQRKSSETASGVEIGSGTIAAKYSKCCYVFVSGWMMSCFAPHRSHCDHHSCGRIQKKSMNNNIVWQTEAPVWREWSSECPLMSLLNNRVCWRGWGGPAGTPDLQAATHSGPRWLTGALFIL